LGAALAAYLLPPTGLDLVVDAVRRGLDWTDSATFWQFGGVAAGMSKKLNPSTAALSANVATGTRARTAGSRRPALSPSRADTAPTHSPALSFSSPVATPLKAAFQVALRDYVESLRQRGLLNYLQASGWVSQDTLYLVGKEAAAALRRHYALAGHEQRLKNNAVLYRLLLGCQLTERREDKPVWNITVMEAGESRKAATLKIPVATLWPEAAGRIKPFTGVIVMPGQPAPGPSISMAKISRSESCSRGDDALGYSTLFDE
jgi:hypothetical protein